MRFSKKTNPRRDQLHKNMVADKFLKVCQFITLDFLMSMLITISFVVACVLILSFEFTDKKSYIQMLPLVVIISEITITISLYVFNYQKRVIKNHARALAMSIFFLMLVAITKFGVLMTDREAWAIGSAVAASIILAICYNQRFAISMTIFFCLIGFLAVGIDASMKVFFAMLAGAVTCGFSLGEIRTRTKMLNVTLVAVFIVFITSVSLSFLVGTSDKGEIFKNAGYNSAAVFLVGFMVQGFLPIIEKVFRVVTSMTLLAYSDANQELLKRLAMEAPGTFSHCLLVGSISETAAESIGRNGLLCRVGAYYHDIGKINKPTYFVENEMGQSNRHKELSPPMSQLIIVGHVKDGVEMAKEYKLPAVLRQFIETHHGTTLVEYFYNEAKKLQDEKQGQVLESEFRYPGPKPRTKEAAIVMIADAVEGAARSLTEITPTKIETVVHNIAMKRLQDGQFDECDLNLSELSKIEAALSKSLAGHYHGRIAYPKRVDEPSWESKSNGLGQ
ncbi:MAG TPA: HDIG domain-containing protein [Sedimentisphaerales bacterium]|nr:HDIG domain-containing protein [Sedimentisphaerales bacterium]